LIRVIDESGEDYLFPADLFVQIEFPATARDPPWRATVSGRQPPGAEAPSDKR
jgi:hypothetical protein